MLHKKFNFIELPLLSIVFFISNITPCISLSRWAETKDAPYAINFEKIRIKIKKDGTYIVQTEKQMEILKESARINNGLTRLTYNENANQFKILEARTINPEKTIPVPKKDIETKPLASSGPGFDTTTQVTVAFQDVNVGSKLYLKYEKIITKPQIPGLFNYLSIVGMSEYVQDFEFSATSEIPFYYEINDPEKSFEIVTGHNSFRAKLKKPGYRAVLEEDYALLVNSSVIWIGVTTLKSWREFPRKTMLKYEETMNSPLPEKLEKILKTAQEKTTEIDQMNAVTSSLADAVRYVGDWRAVNGAYHPRSLSAIAKSSYGDCKDFTVSTGAILKKLGFEVHAAWIARGKDMILSPLKLPVLDVNHAILYAKKNEREYWIDATNPTSFAQGSYEDISGRPAIVLFPDGAKQLQVPKMQASDGSIDVKIDLDFSNDEVIAGQGEFSLLGNMAESTTGYELSTDKQSIDYALVTWATNRKNLISWDFANYNLKSRIVKDFKTSFKFKEPWFPLVTSAGPGYSIPPMIYVDYFQGRNQQRVAAINLPTLSQIHQQYHIKGRTVQLPKELECKGSSEWADFSRRFSKVKDGLILTDDFKMKAKTISPVAVNSAEFSAFKIKLVSCMQNAVIVFR